MKLYLATRHRNLSFNQLCPNNHRIQYKRWCSIENKEVTFNEVKKGYKVSKDNYITIEKTKEDIKLKYKTIDIKEFIESKELNPILFERTYYVAPDTKLGAVNKTYSLNTLTCQLTI